MHFDSIVIDFLHSFSFFTAIYRNYFCSDLISRSIVNTSFVNILKLRFNKFSYVTFAYVFIDSVSLAQLCH